MIKNTKGEKILLFCDNPACFATHIARKNYLKHFLKVLSEAKK